ncbi:hypothetical protein SVAN01_00519 [Stagonosporopsis vannaccii]|nr:hypothetical protein SVAN01_00519 [Stagonosporopsis vannaccii]
MRTFNQSGEESFSQTRMGNPIQDAAYKVPVSVSNVERYEHLEAQNGSLLHALVQSEAEVQSAQRATRDLATWALQERTRLMAEAQHQRVLRENYEAVLRQRDEQVTYLLALHQEAQQYHPRTRVREGEAIGRPVTKDCVKRNNQMRAPVALPLIYRYGPVRDDSMVEEDVQSKVEDENANSELHALEVDEDGADEEAYSPPDVGHAVSIDAQVDELIAEEKGRPVKL